MLSPDQKGAIAEAAIAAEAIKLGIGVSKPLGPLRYDLIFDVGDRLLRVQCKWAIRSGDAVVVRFITSRRGPDGFIRSVYSPSEIDACAAYCFDLDRCYFFPIESVAGRRAFQLRLAPTRNTSAWA